MRLCFVYAIYTCAALTLALFFMAGSPKSSISLEMSSAVALTPVPSQISIQPFSALLLLLPQEFEMSKKEAHMIDQTNINHQGLIWACLHTAI